MHQSHHSFHDVVDAAVETTGEMLRGACAGMIGGFVASWVMIKFQEATKPAGPCGNGRRRQGDAEARERSEKRQREAEQQQQAAHEATVKTAEKVSRKLFDHELSETEKQLAAPAIHYAYGTAVGGLYGAVSEVWPFLDVGFGMGYGMALWLLGSEAAVPALRLGPPPTKASPTQHADALASHLVYGITLDLVRRVALGVL